LNALCVGGVLLNHESERRRANDIRDGDALRLLVVEDDPDYRAWIVAVTRRMKFIVDAAADGQEALERLAEKAYDLAVVDLEMPRLTGLDLIERIRTQESTKALYTLMLTSRGELEMKLMALNAGFDDFLSKASPESEIAAKLVVARRIVARQRTLDATVRELYGLATRDELTGVFNRRFFVLEAERMLALRDDVNIVLFDLDDFKKVNDDFGHLAGDRVLRDIGALFHRRTRPEDLIARYGGDEFVMVVAHLELHDIECMVERLSAEVRALQWSAGEEQFSIGVTTGVGSSRYIEQANVAQLLEAADRDLYKNKWVRRNPGERPELYTYPAHDRRIDLLAQPRVAEASDVLPSSNAQTRKRHDA
jgi:two-component system cell cycle response regulator